MRDVHSRCSEVRQRAPRMKRLTCRLTSPRAEALGSVPLMRRTACRWMRIRSGSLAGRDCSARASMGVPGSSRTELKVNPSAAVGARIVENRSGAAKDRTGCLPIGSNPMR